MPPLDPEGKILELLQACTPDGDKIDVSIQDSTSNLFQYFLQTEVKKDITLTSDVVINDESINVSAGHGITVGDSLVLKTNSYFMQVSVKSVAINVIGLSSPTYLPFTQTDTTITRGSREMAVDGSGGDIEYVFTISGANVPPVDISTAIIIMTHATAADDGKFGGMAELTNGVYFRKENTTPYNLGNYKNNQDFRLLNAVVEYTDKAPAGINGTNIKFFINGQENFGQVIRMQYGDTLKAIIRDDLDGSGNLTSFKTSLIGSYTSGE